MPHWPTWQSEKARIIAVLKDFCENVHALPGIRDPAALNTLAMQMIASLRRQHYTQLLLDRPVDARRCDPSNELFDPERATIWYIRNGNIDEAAWLLFLSVHFGKHLQHGWTRLAHVYSGLHDEMWTWERISSDPDSFRRWLQQNSESIGGAFGNHRKYETLNPRSDRGLDKVLTSYVRWVGPERSHQVRFNQLVREGGNDPEAIFEAFYESFDVKRMGRLGKFDFLCLLGRFGLVPMAPGRTYLKNATGPLPGAKLLFGGSTSYRVPWQRLEELTTALDERLAVGSQVMEDSLCNWQKSPFRFIHFKG